MRLEAGRWDGKNDEVAWAVGSDWKHFEVAWLVFEQFAEMRTIDKTKSEKEMTKTYLLLWMNKS
jgi:hypothetical protein